MIFDGKTLTVLHRDANVYAQADVPGTLDHLFDTLRTGSTSPFLPLICFYRTTMAS